MKRQTIPIAVMLIIAACAAAALADALVIIARPVLPWFAWMLP